MPRHWTVLITGYHYRDTGNTETRAPSNPPGSYLSQFPVPIQALQRGQTR